MSAQEGKTAFRSATTGKAVFFYGGFAHRKCIMPKKIPQRPWYQKPKYGLMYTPDVVTRGRPMWKKPYSRWLHNDIFLTFHLDVKTNILLFLFNRIEENEVNITPKEIAATLQLQPKTVYNALASLQESKALVRIQKGTYLMNPHCFWIGTTDEWLDDEFNDYYGERLKQWDKVWGIYEKRKNHKEQDKEAQLMEFQP